MGALGVTPYIDRALEVLELAERGNDPEHRALVIARDGTVAGTRVVRRDRRHRERRASSTPPCSRRASTPRTSADG